MGRIKGKAVIITGGYGRAGKKMSRLFAKEGAKVIIVGTNENSGICLQDEILAEGGEALFVKTDTTDEAQVKNCVDVCIKTYGKVDVLVNIACIMGVDTGYLQDVTEEMFDKDIAVNLKGSFFFVKHVLPHMVENQYGNIINFSTIGASRGLLGHTIYGAAKAGVESMTRSIVAQYGKQGIRANCIRPGVMLEEADLEKPGVQEYYDSILSHLPAKRVGNGMDPANFALFLASDESTYINGQVITMDGGLTLHEPQWKEDMNPENADAVR